jgi:hypothetical protein
VKNVTRAVVGDLSEFCASRQAADFVVRFLENDAAARIHTLTRLGMNEKFDVMLAFMQEGMGDIVTRDDFLSLNELNASAKLLNVVCHLQNDSSVVALWLREATAPEQLRPCVEAIGVEPVLHAAIKSNCQLCVSALINVGADILQAVTHLDFYAYDVTVPVGLRCLEKAAPYLTNLSSLVWSDWSANLATPLGRLGSTGQLTSLVLEYAPLHEYADITLPVMEALAPAIGRFHNLKVLSLKNGVGLHLRTKRLTSENEMNGTVILKNMLQNLTKLEVLNIAGLGLLDAGVRALAPAFRRLPRLKRLDVSRNSMNGCSLMDYVDVDDHHETLTTLLEDAVPSKNAEILYDDDLWDYYCAAGNIGTLEGVSLG